MKRQILVEVEAPNILGDDASLSREFNTAAHLILSSRLPGPVKTITVTIAQDAVLVDADALIRLQRRVTVK